ncbi:MAG: tRNA-intron lyase [Asgard group archaeon]|nr:tRNA-intron lyase [Asgard group archaeon]
MPNEQAKKPEKSSEINAELIEQRVIVWDHDEGSKLYADGFFGKPLGIRKPKGESFDRPLELTLIEACYLVEKKKINVKIKETNQILTEEILISIGKKHIDLFEEKMLIYKDIRNRGLIPRPGLKFGADFAVYQQGPGLDHSPYVITALPRGSELTAIELVRAGRLATSVRKKFVIATILHNNEVRYFGFVWQKP